MTDEIKGKVEVAKNILEQGHCGRPLDVCCTTCPALKDYDCVIKNIGEYTSPSSHDSATPEKLRWFTNYINDHTLVPVEKAQKKSKKQRKRNVELIDPNGNSYTAETINGINIADHRETYLILESRRFDINKELQELRTLLNRHETKLNNGEFE